MSPSYLIAQTDVCQAYDTAVSQHKGYPNPAGTQRWMTPRPHPVEPGQACIFVCPDVLPPAGATVVSVLTPDWHGQED